MSKKVTATKFVLPKFDYAEVGEAEIIQEL